MKRLVSVFVILLAIAGGAYYYFSYSKPVEKPQVAMATLSTGNITEVVQATGTIEPIRSMNIGSQVSGMVKEIYVDFNSIVRQGQLLAEIDPQLLQVQVDLQMANVARQEGEIANQEVQLEDAKKQLERTQMLFDKQLANQQQLDQALLTVKTRATALDAAKRQMQTVQANLEQAKLNVSYTKIYAPIDGVIVDRVVDRGQFVQSSMTAPNFFRMATDLRTLKLSAGVDEAEIGKIQPGMQVNFRVDAYPTSRFTGVVEQVRLNATSTQGVVTYPVWISVPNPDLRLRPSMTASIEITVREKQGVLRVPNQATRFRPTADMYTALGLTPPPVQPGRAAGANAEGGRRGGGGDAAPAANAGAAPAAAGASPQAAAGREGRGGGDAAGQRPQRQGQGGDNQQARGGQGGEGRQGGFGQGRQGQGGQGGRGFANMTPEERQRMMAQMGGRGGAGRGGRGGRGGASNATTPPVELTTEKIDDMYQAMPVRIQNVQVWQWDEAAKALTDKRVQIGITDGQFSELISGDIKAGDQVVTNIVLPISAAQRQQQQQNIFGGQGQRGFGGPQPGGPGGGGQRGGGGGGGGRGGN